MKGKKILTMSALALVLCSCGKKEKVKFDLDLYKNKNGEYCLYDKEYCSKKADTIKVKTEDAKIIATDKFDHPEYFLIEDDGLTLYNIKSKKMFDVKLNSNYDEYRIISLDNKPIAIYYTSGEKENGLYNIKEDKILYKNQNMNFFPINTLDNENNFGTSSNYVVSVKEKDQYSQESTIYSLSKEKEVKTINGNLLLDYEKDGKHLYFSGSDLKDASTLIYDNNLRNIGSGSIADWEINEDVISIISNNKVKEFNLDGKLLHTSSYKAKEMVAILKNYVLYVNNKNELVMNNGPETIKVMPWKKNYVFPYFMANEFRNTNERVHFRIYKTKDNVIVHEGFDVTLDKDNNLKVEDYKEK